jgi:pimeloyl-ACP methyl ester carboxylesterase
MRETVLKVVMDDLNRKLPNGGELVVVGHSLGSVVAYDLLTALPGTYRVRQFITAGSPLGMPVVQRHLLGADGGPKAAVPAAVPRRSNGWLNAYDVLDFVALLHPLAGEFAETVPGQVTDERTHNATGPHSISDYLADPDVAGPIGRALEF